MCRALRGPQERRAVLDPAASKAFRWWGHRDPLARLDAQDLVQTWQGLSAPPDPRASKASKASPGKMVKTASMAARALQGRVEMTVQTALVTPGARARRGLRVRFQALQELR